MIFLHFPNSKRDFAVCSVIGLLLSLCGCAPVISKELRDQVAAGVTFTEVSRNPGMHKGHIVLWAGVILKRKNTREGIFLEILQTPAGFRGEPGDIYLSKGRFLALNEDCQLNSSIYTKGRGVTVAGELQGTAEPLLPSDASSQTQYPLILIEEIHPWPGEDRDSIYNRPYFWSPWGLP